jgi:hypothetical protein
MAKRKRGRPPVPADKLKTNNGNLRYDSREKATFQSAADLARLTLAAWMRTRLCAAAKRELEDAGKPVPLDRG